MAGLGHSRRAGAPDKLKNVPPGQDVDMEGQGEILRIEARPANGERHRMSMDKVTGLIGGRNFRNARRALPWWPLRGQSE